MAKKKTHKKQSFKYAQPTLSTEMTSTSASSVNSPTQMRSANAVVSTTIGDNPFLGQDLTRLGIIAAALIVLEFGLWILFTHTSVGPTIYNLYKISA